MILEGVPNQRSIDRLVLFAFDDVGLPLKNGVRLHLVPYKSRRDRSRIVVEPGPPGAPDGEGIYSAGTVCRVGDELWMWYQGHDRRDEWRPRLCLATSRDGYRWKKPDLGIVEIAGAMDNNALVVPGEENETTHLGVVFHDPADPDPERRFKAVFAISKRLAAAVSADGLRWQELDGRPELPLCEVSGGTMFNGAFYVSGHGGGHYGAPRQLVVFASYDFEHWSEATCLGFRRENIPPRPVVSGFNEGEQVHGGAALWNRGNVVVGFYGQWHGPANNDRRHIDMDLGLVVSNDALHYREPIPDFRLVDAAEDGFAPLPSPMRFKHSGLVQGQGFENIGEETLFWYAPWPEHFGDGVRVASWERDRLGYLRANPEAYQIRSPQASHVLSSSIDLEGQHAQVSLNIDGLSEHAQISAEVIDAKTFLPLPGFSREQCEPITSGLKQRVAWKGKSAVECENGSVRVRVNYSGTRPEDPRLYAIYVDQAPRFPTSP